MTLDELKQQRRWLLWRLEPGKDGKPTKVPYQPNGYKASLLNPKHLHTYADLDRHVVNFSGIGLALGEFDGVAVWGVDIDRCCDAVTGKFSPESRQVVIDLDSYAEYSPSGTGCHIWGIGKLFGKGLQKSYPGCKQIEVKAQGYYHTFTGRHLSKTPATLEERQEQITALYDRVAAQVTPKDAGLVLTIPVSEEERFNKLWAGDISGNNDDHSAADYALCILLAKKFQCNAFKIDAEFRKSGLYRDKWEDREDYRENTITRACAAVHKETPIFADDGETFEDDGVDEYLVEALTKEHEGWFPKGDVSLVGGSSGTGKTYWTMDVFEKVRLGSDVWEHKSKARDYRVLMMDRGAKAMRRTLQKMKLPPEAVDRIIRVTSRQQSIGPVAVMEESTQLYPGAEAWFIEGLDLWLKESKSMSDVAQALDDLQRIATRKNIAIVASVGSPKQKSQQGKESERYHGRDALFGSVAWGRKSETIVLISKTDEDPLHDDCPRQYSVLVRNGRSEHFWMGFNDGKLCMVDRPGPQAVVRSLSKFDVLNTTVFDRFKPGERIRWTADLGASSKTFYQWTAKMVSEGRLEQRKDGFDKGGFFVPTGASTTTTTVVVEEVN